MNILNSSEDQEWWRGEVEGKERLVSKKYHIRMKKYDGSITRAKAEDETISSRSLSY